MLQNQKKHYRISTKNIKSVVIPASLFAAEKAVVAAVEHLGLTVIAVTLEETSRFKSESSLLKRTFKGKVVVKDYEIMGNGGITIVCSVNEYSVGTKWRATSIQVKKMGVEVLNIAEFRGFEKKLIWMREKAQKEIYRNLQETMPEDAGGILAGLSPNPTYAQNDDGTITLEYSAFYPEDCSEYWKFSITLAEHVDRIFIPVEVSGTVSDVHKNVTKIF